MDAAALQDGFTLGDWLVEPRDLRASRGGITIAVTTAQMRVLLCLVESKGAFVDRHALCSRVYAQEPGADTQLRDAILAWHKVFGDSADRPRYVAGIGLDGYSIVAHCAPALRKPLPERLLTARLRRSGTPGHRQPIVMYAQGLLGELRRRRVFRVSAAYLIGMWLLLQVGEVTFAPLHLPEWWITALTILAVMGLPVMIVLAWTYEITSDGVVRDSVDVAAAVRLPNSRRLVAPVIIIGIALMATVTGFAWWKSIESGQHAAPASTLCVPPVASASDLRGIMTASAQSAPTAG